MNTLATLVMMMGMLVGGIAKADTIRVSHLTPEIWDKFQNGLISELIVEFRQGDIIPLTVKTEGDLLETTNVSPSDVTVKTNFWVKLKQNDVTMSLDGATFEPFKDLITGSFTVGASSGQNGGPANSIDAVFKAFLK